MKKNTFKNEAGRNKLLCQLEDENIIPSETYSELFTTCLSPCFLYGLPAIYNYIFFIFQFRTTFSTNNTPGYKISQLLVPILNNMCGTTKKFIITT